MENTINSIHPRPRTAAQAMGIKTPVEPVSEAPLARTTTPPHAENRIQTNRGVARTTTPPHAENRVQTNRGVAHTATPPHAKMKALSEKAHAISIEERDARRTRVLDYLQQVRIATRRDIDRVAGYAPGVSHDTILETLYRKRLIDRIENIDSGQSLYALTARGNSFASVPISLPPLTTFEWQNMTQQEHRLGVARFVSLWLQKTSLNNEIFEDGLRKAMLDGRYVLIGESLMQSKYAEKFGKKTIPDNELLDTLYAKPEPTGGQVSMVYAQAGWYIIPPYIQGQGAARIDMTTEEGTPISQQEATGTLMKRHPADAVLAPVSEKNGQALAIEVERYAKPVGAYIDTMSRYGSVFGRERFGRVVWACANRQIQKSILSAAEKTGTTDMVDAFIYDTRRHGSFIKGMAFDITA
jgi:hypothetical protein